MSRKSKMATTRKKPQSGNRLLEFFSALTGFWPVWMVLLIIIASVMGFQYLNESNNNTKFIKTSSLQNNTLTRQLKITASKKNVSKFVVLTKQQIKISGHINYIDIEKIKSRVIVAMEQGYLSSDLELVRADILKSPWVRTVSIKRIPPRILEIYLTEYVPMMRWKNKGIISDDGVLFFPDLSVEQINIFNAMPVMKVNRGDITQGLDFLEKTLPALQQLKLSFSMLEQDELGGWNITFNDGKKVVFGRKQLTERLKMFKKIWKVAAKKGTVAVMDLRYVNGAAVSYFGSNNG